jgi:hypothetical protein
VWVDFPTWASFLGVFVLIYIRIPSSGGRRDLDLGSFNVS